MPNAHPACFAASRCAANAAAGPSAAPTLHEVHHGITLRGARLTWAVLAGVKRVVVIMDHTSKAGDPKLLKECSLPLTGVKCVDRVITNFGVFDVVEGGLKVVELADGVTLDEVKEKTQATLQS